jgi:hypothetical protein
MINKSHLKMVEERLSLLEIEIDEIKKDREIEFSDDDALEILKVVIRTMKEKGIKSFTIIDLYEKTKIPSEQLGRLVGILEKEKVIY